MGGEGWELGYGVADVFHLLLGLENELFGIEVGAGTEAQSLLAEGALEGSAK